MFANKITLAIKSVTPTIEPTIIPNSAPVLSFEEVSDGSSSSCVVGAGERDVTGENGFAEDWKETESATNVRPSARETEKFPLVTSSLNTETAVETLFSPGPPGSKVNETRMLPGRASTLVRREVWTPIASAMACVTRLINSGLLESVMTSS